MPYRISDLIDLPGFQQVMRAWHSVAGVATALLDIDRIPLCAVGWATVCTRFHHLAPQAERRCTLSDADLLSRLQEGTLVTSSCSNGLMNGAMPVMIKGEHVATLYAYALPMSPDVKHRDLFAQLGCEAEHKKG